MKNTFFFTCLLASLFFVACSSKDSKSYDESLSPATSTKPVTPLTITDTLLSDSGSVRQAPQMSMPTAPATKTTTLSGNMATAKAGANPAHGQPGHRCDIAVGAPLSTPVSASTTASSAPQVKSITSNPITSSPAVSTPSALSSTGSSGKLNPPHGQPGHDCAVEVGKPLKD